MKLTLTLTAALFAGVAPAAPPAPLDPAEHRRAQELVRQLASPRYREREQAALELVKMGRTARLALQEGKKAADPEVHSRCEQLLPQALALDLAFRLEQFLKDPDGKHRHDLPLWKEFREKVGADETARKLYAEMVKANGEILEMVADEPNRLAERVHARAQDMYQEMFGDRVVQRGGGFRAPTTNNAELCCLLFAAAQPAYKPTGPDWALANLYAHPGFGNQLKEVRTGGPYRKLFIAYLDARIDDNTINNSIWFMCQFRVREGADVIARALKAGKATQAQTRAAALCCIGTLGNRDHIPQIAGLFQDDAEVGAFAARNVSGTVKVRDVALAMTIHLSGRNPKDYGFPVWSVYSNSMIPFNQLGFPSNEERAAAFRKWDEESRAESPKK
jgi:hypothetical protein